MNNGGINILNSIKALTAQSMTEDIYMLSRLSDINTQNVSIIDRSKNGTIRYIICGQSVCGTDEKPIHQYCKKR